MSNNNSYHLLTTYLLCARHLGMHHLHLHDCLKNRREDPSFANYKTEVQMDEMMCLMTLGSGSDRALTVCLTSILHRPLLHTLLLEDALM